MNAVVVILASAATILLAVRFLNLIQLDGYGVKYGAAARRAHMRLSGIAACSFLTCFAMYGCYAAGGKGVFEWLAVIFTLVPLAVYGVLEWRMPVKKPLVWTPRATRLIFAFALLICVLDSFLWYAGALTKWKDISLDYIYLTLPVFALPFLLYLCVYIMRPIEKYISSRYVKRARQFFESRPQLIRIGITGSYGKTGVKFILEKMLAEMYNVVATPQSFNTPMGICRSVELIENDTEIFIAEMGARRKGDIKELCDVVKPSYGIITGVNSQHLETFGDISVTAATKFELAEALGKDGYAVFNGDNAYTREMFEKYDKNKGTASLFAGDCVAENVATGAWGSDFELVIGDRRVKCTTALIGRHNVLNIAMAALMAYKLGVSLNQIARAAERLEPVPHRLEILRLPTGVTVIDDSYNSNETGFAAALDTLALFEGRKILITPALVELGGAEKGKNRELGAMAAKVADLVMLIGSRAEDMREGLLGAGFPEENIMIFDTLKEAQDSFPTTLKKRDVVLLENDLPDNYR